MKKIICLTPHDVELGFSLAGVEQLIACKEELEGVLGTIMAEPETGIVIVDERLLGGLTDQQLRDMEKRWYGILLVLPAPEKVRLKTEDYAVRLIKKAIGYHVKVQL